MNLKPSLQQPRALEKPRHRVDPAGCFFNKVLIAGSCSSEQTSNILNTRSRFADLLNSCPCYCVSNSGSVHVYTFLSVQPTRLEREVSVTNLTYLIYISSDFGDTLCKSIKTLALFQSHPVVERQIKQHLKNNICPCRQD